MPVGLLKGHLDLLLLSVLAGDPAHGYLVVERLRVESEGAFDLPDGTVYPALYRLEASGLISSNWRNHGGRKRRVYRLTRSGEKALGEYMKDWAEFQGAVQSVMRAARV
jgi:DNA-binding PadR family transcriptional regulator